MKKAIRVGESNTTRRKQYDTSKRRDLLTHRHGVIRPNTLVFSNVAKTWRVSRINPYPTAFPYGNGMVLHFYQQQESSTTKTVHKVINKGLKAYV